MERRILSQDAYDTIAATVFCTTALDNKWTSIDVECFGKDSTLYNLSYISFSSSPIFRRALIGILARIFSATIYGFTLSLSIHCLRVLFKNSPKDPKEAVAHNYLAGYSILFLAFGTASLFDNFRLAMYDLFGTSFDDKHFQEVPIGFHMNTNTYAPLFVLPFALFAMGTFLTGRCASIYRRTKGKCAFNSVRYIRAYLLVGFCAALTAFTIVNVTNFSNAQLVSILLGLCIIIHLVPSLLISILMFQHFGRSKKLPRSFRTFIRCFGAIFLESCAAVPLSELSCIILSHRSIFDGALAQVLFFGLTNICAISTLFVIVRIGEGNDILSMQRPELEA